MKHKTCLHTLVLAAALLFAVTGTAAHAVDPEPTPPPELKDSGDKLDDGVDVFEVDNGSAVEVYVGQEFTLKDEDAFLAEMESRSWSSRDTSVVTLRGSDKGYRDDGWPLCYFYGYFKAAEAPGEADIELNLTFLGETVTETFHVTVKPIPVDVELTANSETREYNGTRAPMTNPVTIKASINGEDTSAAGKAMYEAYKDTDLSKMIAVSKDWPEEMVPGSYSGKPVIDSEIKYYDDALENWGKFAIKNEKRCFESPTLIITPRKITVTVPDAAKTYGDPDPDFNYTVDVKNVLPGNTLGYTVTRDEGEDHGTYPLHIRIDSIPAYHEVADPIAEGTLTIKQRELTAEIPSVSKEYDGTPLKADPIEIRIPEGFDKDKVVTLTPINSVTDVTPAPVPIEYLTDWGSLSVTNYVLTVTDGTMTVTPRPIELHIRGTQQTVPYSGSEQSARPPYFEQVGEYPDGLTAVLAETFANRAKGTKAGDYAMGLTSGDFTAGGANAGNYAATFVLDADGCLHIEKPGPDAISANVSVDGWIYGEPSAAPETSVTFNGAAIDYPEAPVITYAAADGGAPAAEPPQDAGRYTVTASWAETEDWPAVSAQAAFTVAKRSVMLTSADAEKVYDGEPLTAGSITVGGMGWAAGDGAEYTVTGSQLNAGSSANTFTYTLQAGTRAQNYQITLAPGKLTVDPLALAAEIPDVNKEYDGAPLRAAPVEIPIEQGADMGKVITLTPTNSVTNVTPEPVAIEYTTDWGGLSQTNYTLEVTAGTLTVTRKPVTLHVKGTEQIAVYSGSEQSAKPPYFEPVGECPAGLTVALAEDFESKANGTEVNRYPMGLTENDFTVSGANAGNYTVTVVLDADGCLRIEKLDVSEITTEIVVKDWIYGEPHAAPMAVAMLKGTRVVYPEEATLTYTAADGSDLGSTAPTDAGRYTVTAVWTETPNLSALKAQAEFTIEKRPVTLTGASAEKVYDGTPLTADSVTVGGMGWAAGEGAEYKVTGSRTDAGSSANTFTYTLNEGTEADNYEITKAEGTLTVTRRPVTLCVQSYEKKEGKKDPGFETHAVGLVEKEELQNYAVMREPGQTPGIYGIRIYSTALGANPNYRVETVDGTLTITASEEPVDNAALLVQGIKDVRSGMDKIEGPAPTAIYEEVVQWLKAQKDTLQSSMAANNADRDELAKELAKLEDLYAQKANIAFTVDSTVDAVEESNVSIVGAAFSKNQPGEMFLRIGEGIPAPDPNYTSVLTVDIGLFYKESSTSPEEQVELAVPVCIELPLPGSITDPADLLIYHYHDGTRTEILPVVFMDVNKGRWMARFCTDSFSTFDFVLPKSPAPAPAPAPEPGAGGGRSAADTEDGAADVSAAPAAAAACRGTVPQTADAFPLRGAAAAFALSAAGLAAVQVMRRRRR